MMNFRWIQSIAPMILALLVSLPGLAATLEAGQYKIDTDHAHIGFSVSHLGISLVVGRFDTFSGEFHFEPNGESGVSVDIVASSVNTNQERRDKHLRGSDFFHVSRYPKLSFQSTKVEYADNGDPIEVHGRLELHGVEKEVILDVRTIGAGEGPFGKYRAGFQATTTILRSEFGMDKLLALAGDEIAITLNIEGIRQ